MSITSHIMLRRALAHCLVACLWATGFAAAGKAAEPPIPVEYIVRGERVFDSAMFDNPDAAFLAAAQKRNFPVGWQRLRRAFAEAAAARLLGYRTEEETHAAYGKMIRDEFDAIRIEIEAHRSRLAQAPTTLLLAQERAMRDLLATLNQSYPGQCLDLAAASLLPPSGNPTVKFRYLAATWDAYRAGADRPAGRILDPQPKEDWLALRDALVRQDASPQDISTLFSGDAGPLRAGQMSCERRRKVADAILMLEEERAARIVAFLFIGSPTNL